MNKNIILYLLVFLLISCSEAIDLDIPTGKEQLVVNSIITPKEQLNVSVSLTSQMLKEDKEEPKEVEVELWENNKFVKSLTKVAESQYTSSFFPSVESEYQIITKTKNYETAKASCSIPEAVPITEGYLRYNSYYDNYNQYMLDEVGITFTDPEDKENYYEISFFELDYDYASYINGLPDTTQYRVRGLSLLQSHDQIFIEEGDEQFVSSDDCSTLLFSDKYIKNPCSITLYCYGATFLESSGGKPTIKPVYAILRSVSYEYYTYKKSWLRHKYNQSTIALDRIEDMVGMAFTGNPFDMYTNIEGGLGIFAGYSESHIELNVRNN